MTENTTSVGTNVTKASSSDSSTGLAVGLTFFFLLLVIIACVIIYKYHPKIRGLVNFGQRERQEKEDCAGTPQGESHHYSSTIREQSVGQTPIYENLSKPPAAHPSRSPEQPEENLYLQCDPTDDAIYNNYPAFNSNLPDPQEEDVYIVPDSL